MESPYYIDAQPSPQPPGNMTPDAHASEDNSEFRVRTSFRSSLAARTPANYMYRLSNSYGKHRKPRYRTRYYHLATPQSVQL